MHPIHPRSWPIRWRLTALNVGVLAVTLALMGGISLLQLDSALVDITAGHLREQVRVAIQRPEGRGRGGGPERGPGPPGSVGFEREAPDLVRRLSGPDTGVLIFRSDGVLLATNDWFDDQEDWPRPTDAQRSAVLAGGERTVVVQQETRRTLVMLQPLRAPDGSIVGVMELARSLELTDLLEARLRLILVVGTAIALLVGGILTFRATRAALGPLDSVVRAARKIEAGHLDERLRLTRRDEIGELAEAFDRMLDRLAAALEAQRRFVADAAHELRTPLTALGGMVEMLQMGADRGDPSTVRRMLDTMDREIGRLGRLVTDLLTLSRLDGTQQPLRLAPVELAPLVAEVAQQTRILARGQDVEVRVMATPTVQGDADRLKQVLINLAANALAFTPEDGRIEFRVDEADGRARLSVADTGSGIAPELLPRVMDRFTRGDASRARSTGGSGLGLAIARGIVEAHGGTLALESHVGRGTTALVDLPVRAGLSLRPAREWAGSAAVLAASSAGSRPVVP